MSKIRIVTNKQYITDQQTNDIMIKIFPFHVTIDDRYIKAINDFSISYTMKNGKTKRHTYEKE